MASETFVSAMMLITAVVAATILITAVFPVVWTMVSTFSSASHETDTRMRTDFKIVTTYANTTPSGGVAKVWMKNIGSSRIGTSEIEKSDTFIGLVGDFNRASLVPGPAIVHLTWSYLLLDDPHNEFWDPGETLEVDAACNQFTFPVGKNVYFQFVLPSGVSRDAQFTTS